MCAVHTLAYFQTGDMKDVKTERGPYGHFDGTLFIQSSNMNFGLLCKKLSTCTSCTPPNFQYCTEYTYKNQKNFIVMFNESKRP